MGLFSRKKSLAERFPVERLSYLPMSLGGAIEGCAREHKLDSNAVWGSKFIGGYLLGYSNFLNDVDERLSEAVRQMIFTGMFGPEEGRAAFKTAMGLFLLDDQQIKRGWGAGAPDGERYFRALEMKRDSSDSTDSLKVMFEIGMVDIGQQLI